MEGVLSADGIPRRLAPCPQEPSPAPGTRGPVVCTLWTGWCSPDSRRLLICYLLTRCSEHRFKLHLVQQPKRDCGSLKKEEEERPLCVWRVAGGASS